MGSEARSAWAVCPDCCVIPVVGPIYLQHLPAFSLSFARFLILLFVRYLIRLAQLAAPWKSRCCQDADWPSRMAQIFRDILLIVNQLADREPVQQGPVTN